MPAWWLWLPDAGAAAVSASAAAATTPVPKIIRRVRVGDVVMVVPLVQGVLKCTSPQFSCCQTAVNALIRPAISGLTARMDGAVTSNLGPRGLDCDVTSQSMIDLCESKSWRT
ncbi:hypothetical protein GCM10008112_32040 [Flexivirga endophytica]|nr:hypothetical protein GCM10008112_32040 [Flexivirga endophytica]